MGSFPIVSVLVANHSLCNYGGTESYSYSIIKELVERGIDVEYFTFHRGIISEKIEKDFGINFMSKKNYSFIFANHKTCVEHLFVRGFTIQTCHGVFPILEQPSFFADKHISISEEVKNHLFIKGFKTQIIRNGIDTSRFYSKNNINENLKIILSLCHGEKANELIAKACGELGISLITKSKYLNGVWNIEKLINDADLVIGLGRSVLEAMSCGRPVIVYDSRHYMEQLADGYIFNCIEESKENNFSGRSFNIKYNKEKLKDDIKKYNCSHGEFLSFYIRQNFNIKAKVDEYLKLKKTVYLSKNILVTSIQLFKILFGARIAFQTMKVLRYSFKLLKTK